VVSGGTDTHLLLVDVFSKGVRGKDAQTALSTPASPAIRKRDPIRRLNPPMNPSGMRFGSPASPRAVS